MMVGDVVGRPGRKAAARFIPQLREEEKIDFVILNGENSAAGFGITAKIADELLSYGVDCITSGNHIWTQKTSEELVRTNQRVLRPANYPPACAGSGANVFQAANGTCIGVINLQGLVFMPEIDCPFRCADHEIQNLTEMGAQAIFIDFHAEATSEKIALGQYLDGRAAAVVGTHTHVMTADDMILPGGTAYLSDVGMTGPCDGTIIGVQSPQVIERFLKHIPQRFQVPTSGKARFGAVIIEYSLDTQRAKHIQRIERFLTTDGVD